MLKSLRAWVAEKLDPTPPAPTHLVQLHRVAPNEDEQPEVVYSWTPVEAHSQEEAYEIRERLYRDNNWAASDGWPYVSITWLR